MNETIQEKNKALCSTHSTPCLTRGPTPPRRSFGSPNCIQHSAHIEPAREGLFNLVKTLPPTLKYEPATIVANGNFVIVRDRFAGFQAATLAASELCGIRVGHGFRSRIEGVTHIHRRSPLKILHPRSGRNRE